MAGNACCIRLSASNVCLSFTDSGNKSIKEPYDPSVRNSPTRFVNLSSFWIYARIHAMR